VVDPNSAPMQCGGIDAYSRKRIAKRRIDKVLENMIGKREPLADVCASLG
jgi:hypothetical protein